MCFETFTHNNADTDPRSPEKRFTDLIRAELGIDINPQAWRIFLRHNKRLAAGYFHRIVDDKP